MHPNRSIVGTCVGVVLCAFACLIPWEWVAFPAAVVLTLWLPGRSVVCCLRELDGVVGKAWMGMAASMVLLPVLLSWVWRCSNDRTVVLVAVVGINLILLWLSARCRSAENAPPMFPSRRMRNLFAVMVIWIALCVFGSFWLPRAGGRVGVTGAHDYTKHHAIMLSLEHHKLPLHNVFCAVESDTPYYYYEYHYLLPASLRTMTGNRVSIAFAFGFVGAVQAAVFIALVYLLALELLGSAKGALLSAACVSIVGGWDMAAVLIQMVAGGSLVITLDAWCPVPWRIHNLATQFYWCPQHVCAMVALVVSCLWLSHAPSARWWLIVAPLLGASIFGSSVYLAIPIFIAAGVYALLRVAGVSSDGLASSRVVGAFAVIAVVGAGMMGVQAWGYSVMGDRFEGGLTMHWERFPLALVGRLLPPGPVANFLDVPWLVLVDFGLPALALVCVSGKLWSAGWRNPGMRLLMISGGVGLVAMFTVRSDINPIDYGFRVAIMPTMVMAAILAGAWLNGDGLRRFARRWRKPVLVGGVLLGLPVGFYEAPLAAVRTLLQKQPFNADAGAIRFLRNRTPPDAVIQGDPRARANLPQMIDRQMGVADPQNAHVRVFWPPSLARLQQAIDDVEKAFTTDSSQEAYTLLRKVYVTHLLVGEAERSRYGQLKQYDDAAYFTAVYQDDHAAVYRLAN